MLQRVNPIVIWAVLMIVLTATGGFCWWLETKHPPENSLSAMPCVFVYPEAQPTEAIRL